MRNRTNIAKGEREREERTLSVIGAPTGDNELEEDDDGGHF